MTARCLWAALLFLAVALSPAQAGEVLIAHEVQTFATSGPQLTMPTSVAVGLQGEVYVADGVRRRVVVFGSDGAVARVIETVAGRSLQRPMAVGTSDDGRLWIADGDARLVAVVEPSGHSYTVGLDPSWRATIDLTGLAASADGQTLWLVDNDHHRVLRGDLQRGRWVSLGEQGPAFGQLHYPVTVALGPDGQAWVADVLNGRVQGFTPTGRATRPVGRFGVNPGQLHRPRGVAVDEGGRVWVSDATLGVVQVFTEAGRLVDVVQDPGGGPLRLRHPAGITLDGDHLYVVELGAARVRSFRIESGEGQAHVARKGRPVGEELSSPECTVCHLEAVPDLQSGGGGALIARPKDSKLHPYVSTDGACLSCHDGSVLDSRRKVWGVGGHTVDKEPLDTMSPPKDLPLADGRIVCRTCHTAHSLGGSGQQHADALMLRVARRPSELCSSCHDAQDEHEGTPHPVGAIEAGIGGISPDVDWVDCLDCHVNHGVEGEALLQPQAWTDACVTCHIGFGEHASGMHPVEVDRKAARTATARGGALHDGAVACLSCHGVHSGPEPVDRCVVCHERLSPERGDEPPKHAKVGCLECHLAHEGAGVNRRGRATLGDPSGCLYCHGEGAKHEPIEAHPGSLGHAMVDAEEPTDPPLEGCPSCHGAHDSTPRDHELCETCHVEQEEEMARGGHGDTTCLDCHPTHDRTVLAEVEGGLNPVSRRCLSCHGPEQLVETSVKAPSVGDYEHPSPQFTPDGERWTALADIPLFGADGRVLPPAENGDLTCASCHRTHGPDREHPGTKRRRPEMPQSCSNCHGTSALPYYLYFHKPARRERFKKDDPAGVEAPD